VDGQMHIAVVDDDVEINTLLSEFLTQHGYKTTTAHNAEELFALLKIHNDIDLIVLDLLMPGIDGLETCKRLKAESNTTPIIMVTAISDVTEKILGLELGADDYLTKPFSPRELLARIKAVLRRSHTDNTLTENHVETTEYPKGSILAFNGWTLNLATRQLLSHENVEISLTSRTYDLLLAFLEHPQRILSRDQLLTILSNRTAEPFDRSVDVQVSRLRQKLNDDPKEPKLIKTVRSGGYLFTSPVKHR
jgi:two-component system OmpR family response regulator